MARYITNKLGLELFYMAGWYNFTFSGRILIAQLETGLVIKPELGVPHQNGYT